MTKSKPQSRKKGGSHKGPEDSAGHASEFWQEKEAQQYLVDLYARVGKEARDEVGGYLVGLYARVSKESEAEEEDRAEQQEKEQQEKEPEQEQRR